MTSQTKIFCIDDDQSFLEMLSGFFEREGFSVSTAGDGKEGLEEFRTIKPDIVLVDLRMPNVSGFEVLEAISEESPNTPVIVISGEGEMADVIQALRLGAWNYQTKPIENLALIRHAVDQALEKANLAKEIKAYQEGLEKKLGTIVENFDGFIFTCDKDFKITYVNPALTEHIGRDAIGEKCHKAIFGMDSKCPWCSDEMAFEGQAFRQEIQNPKDGRWYLTILSPILDKDGQIAERQIILYDITERKQALLDLQEREEYLRKENLRLRASFADRYKFGKIIGKSKPMLEVYETIINAAATDASVIIYGESGTGKELVAESVHENSDRKNKKLVYVNCGAIPENLIESEFFGYKKGAFTGAAKDKYGFLDIANGGSLFLDEVGEIPLSMQVKLLRAIEGSGYTPVGGAETKKSDVRIIAATNRDLKEMVRQGQMRQDFLYRIHIIPIALPPLRERKEDIPLLVDHFLSQYDKEKVPALTPQIFKSLQDYDWPGNVRELQNTINRLVTLKKLDFMGMDFVDQSEGEALLAGIDLELSGQSLNAMLAEVEKNLLIKAFEKYSWHQGQTAEALQVDRKTLYRKMKQLGINKPPEK